MGPGAPEPPAAPSGTPEPEDAELEDDEGGRGGLDLGLKPAESRLISGGDRQGCHVTLEMILAYAHTYS